MRTARIKIDGHGYYHVMTHLVAGTPWMGPAEKEQFRKLMRAYETFSGLRVMTYSIMGTHAHIFLEVPERQEVDEQEIVRRIRYFSDSAVLGSREFVNTVFLAHRECFGPKRQEGARALRFGDWGGLCGARDLRKSPLMAPSPSDG